MTRACLRASAVMNARREKQSGSLSRRQIERNCIRGLKRRPNIKGHLGAGGVPRSPCRIILPLSIHLLQGATSRERPNGGEMFFMTENDNNNKKKA